MGLPEQSPAAGDAGPEAAVIDIGSNSIRLVIYEGLFRAPLVLFEDKVMCGLGRGLAETGRLWPEARVEAFETLARYAAIARLRQVDPLLVVATAALRDAADGAEFKAELETKLGLDIHVIAGDEEARLAAAGVLAAFPEAEGVVADIGGGSLDMALIRNGMVEETTSLRLGPYRLMPLAEKATAPPVIAHIERSLRQVPWLSAAQGLPLYAVGGAWRTIGAIHLDQKNYPLNVINGYQIPSRELRALSAELAARSPHSLKKLRQVGSRRAQTLPFSAIAFALTLDHFQPDRCIICAQGLREGVLFDRLAPADQQLDPILDVTRRLARRMGSEERAAAVGRWLLPLIPPGFALPNRLVRAALYLSEYSRFEHPSYQAQHAYARILRLPTAALTHHDRALLALIGFQRYGGDSKASRTPLVNELLSDAERSDARTLGEWIRFAYDLTAGRAEAVGALTLTPQGKTLRAAVPAAMQPLMTPRRRQELIRLAGRLGWPLEFQDRAALSAAAE